MPCLILFKNRRFRKAAKHGNVDRLRYLLLNGADVDSTSKYGRTALHKAAIAGQADAVKFLLDEANADWEVEQGPMCYIPLWNAVEEGHNHILPWLLAKKHNVDHVNKALTTAILDDNREGVKILLKGGEGENSTLPADPNAPTKPLKVAADKGHEKIALYLLEQGAKVVPPTQHPEDDAPLHLAIRNGMANLTTELLKRGADVNATGNDRRTPLSLAMEYFPSCTPTLLQYKPNMDTTDVAGDTPLHKAAESHRDKEIDMLLQAGAKVNEQNKKGETPLLRAVMTGFPGNYIETVQKLLDNGADPDMASKSGDNPLCGALEQERFDLTRVLLHAGAKANVMDSKKRTPLYFATGANQNKMVDLLLRKHQADPNFGSNKDTPLAKAVRLGYQSIALALLDAKANPNRADAHQNPPLALALKVKEKVDIDIFGKLLKCGADPNAMDADKNPILYLAVKKGSYEAVKTLLGQKKHIVDPNVKSGRDDTCLGRACRDSNAKIACKLLEAGAKANKRDKDNETPLSLVLQEAKQCDTSLLHLLIEKGADLEAKSAAGVTPLCLAVKNQTAEIVYILLQNRADVNKKSESSRPIQAALKRGNEAIIKTLLDCPDLDTNGMHLLLDAVRGKKKELINILIDRCVDVDETNSKGETPLCEAISQKEYEMAKMLLKKNADSDKADPRGTPLLLAARNNNLDMCRFLIKYKADVDRVNGNATALGEAVQNGNDDLVKLLLRERADPNQSHKGKLPLVRATEMESYSIVDALLRNGANPKVTISSSGSKHRNRSQRSPKSSAGFPLIHVMCEQGKTDIVRLMIKEKPEILKVKNGKGFLPIHLVAGEYPNKTLCETILREYPECRNARSSTSANTPLHFACIYGNFSIVRFFVESAGADYNVTNGKRETPLDLAHLHKHGKVARWLYEEIGADHTVSMDDSSN